MVDLVKMKAVQAFEEQDGKFAVDEEFVVNGERALYLTRTGKAVRCVDQSPPVQSAAAPYAFASLRVDDPSQSGPAKVE